LGQVYVTETVFARYFPDFVPDRFGVRTRDVASLRTDLSRDLGLSDSAMINQETATGPRLGAGSYTS